MLRAGQALMFAEKRAAPVPTGREGKAQIDRDRDPDNAPATPARSTP